MASEAASPLGREEVYRDLHAHQLTKQATVALDSARKILSIVASRNPLGDVLDVGCGLGAWMAAAEQVGATHVRGIEGPWLDPGKLLVAPDAVSVVDLMTGNFDAGRTFDTVVSIEVGEHLPAEAAEAFVASLAKHASRVVFSAAIPGQGGHGHVNERFQSYWAGLFAGHGYGCVDAIRPAVWGDRSIPSYLRQNVLLFEAGVPERGWQHGRTMLDVVHPELWLHTSSLFSQVIGILDGAGMIQRGVNGEGSQNIHIALPERR